MSCLALAIAVRGEWSADRLAKKLKSAGVPTDTEIHVACDPEFAPDEPPPSLSVHALSGSSLFDLWSAAIEKSRAPWVAILHADGLPAAGWFSAMERAIEQEGWPDGYWGPVEPDPYITPGSMVGYLTEYCQFHRPIKTGLKEIPGSNLILSRGRIDDSAGFSKTRLLQQGLSPKYVADAVVQYARPFALGDYCRRRFRHGRAYAASRIPRVALVRALPLSLMLPLVRTARVLRHAWRHQELRGARLVSLPAIFVAETCWSLGELTGYVTRRPGELSRLD